MQLVVSPSITSAIKISLWSSSGADCHTIGQIARGQNRRYVLLVYSCRVSIRTNNTHLDWDYRVDGRRCASHLSAIDGSMISVATTALCVRSMMFRNARLYIPW